MTEDGRNEDDDNDDDDDDEEEAADEMRPSPEAGAVPRSTGGVERGSEVEVLELEQLEEILKSQRPSTCPTPNH